MENIVWMVVLGALFQIGAGLQVENPDDTSTNIFTIVLERGDQLNLKCKETFDASAGENIGLNTLKWHKTQKNDEINQPEMGVEVSSLGQITGTFTDRVTATFDFDPTANIVTVPLTIASVDEEDSGWYFCFAKSASKETVYIRYEVQVYMPPSNVLLSGKMEADHNMSEGTGALIFSTNKQGVLECTAVQGFPAPTLRIHIEGEQQPLTGFGQPTTETSLSGGTEGLQRIRHNTTLIVQNVQVRAEQNGKKVFCSATDPRSTAENPMAPAETSRMLSVLYPPRIIDCTDKWEANPGDMNVKFGCTFEANPIPNVLWKAHVGGGNLVDIYPDGKIVDSRYSAQVMATTMKTPANVSIFQTDLNLVSITENSYHRYTLEVTNDQGTDSQEFVLTAGEVAVPTGPVGGANQITTSSLILCILTALYAAIFKQ